MIEFKKAKTINWDKLHQIAWPVIIEEKLDGEAIVISEGKAYGRRISSVSGQQENKWDTLPPWVQALATAREVFGELHVLGGTSTDVKSALKNGRETNWEGDLCKRLGFVAYQVECCQNDNPYHIRNELENAGFTIPKLLYRQEDDPSEWNQDTINKDHLFKLAKERGLEGWMLKDSNGVWWKVKLDDTIDCIVTGVKEGNNKYLGLVGAIKVSVVEEIPCENCLEIADCVLCLNTRRFLREIASVSGMTDDEREEVTEMFDKGTLLGKVCEVKYSLVAAQGRLRHPRFIRWRDDKNPIECVIKEE